MTKREHIERTAMVAVMGISVFFLALLTATGVGFSDPCDPPGPKPCPTPTPTATPTSTPIPPTPSPTPSPTPTPTPSATETPTPTPALIEPVVSAPATEGIPVSVTFYTCPPYCGVMANGEIVHEGAAACGYAFDLGMHFTLTDDPTGRTYTCKDRGHGPYSWVDIFFPDSTDGYAWQEIVGTSGTIHKEEK